MAMEFTHDDVQQHLIDFLYGELQADARAAFDAHLVLCERCRAEVGTFEQTRAVARRVVRAPLADPLPPGVQARVMEALTRAALRGAGAAGAGAPVVPVAGTAPPARPAAPDQAPRWLAWLRARWTIPMFATVAAMGTLLLVRETIFREARRPLGPDVPAHLAPPVTPAAPEQGAPEKAAAEGAGDKTQAVKDLSGSDGARGWPNDSGPGRGAAAVGAGAPSPAERKRAPVRREGRAGGAADVAPAADPVSRPKPKKASPGTARGLGERDRLAEGQSSSAASPFGGAAPAGEFASGKGTDSAADEAAARADDKERFAQPPPPALRRPPALEREAAVAPAASATSARSRAEAAPPPAPAPAPAKGPAAGKSSSARPGADENVGAPSGAVGSGSAPVSAVALSERAERLMAARSWSGAIVAYRELLRRFPQHPSAATWRRRLVAAQTAAAADGGAPRSEFAAPPPAR